MSNAAIVLLLFSVSVFAQTTNSSSNNSSQPAKKAHNEITVKGCVSRFSADYILMQTDPANTYELQPTHKMRLGPYLGQEVEVTGFEVPSMMTSSDASFGRVGAPSSVTIVVHSIRTIASRCTN